MNKQVFSVRDSKVGAYSDPMILRSTGEAIRVFTDSARNPKSTISQHPEDFSLHLIGEFDEIKGVMVPLPHVSFGTAQSFMPRQPEVPETK